MEHYFSSNGVFPIMTSLNDDIPLKIFITLYYPLNIFIVIKPLFLNSQTHSK